MWSSSKIKNLRQRLGWSAVDLSRRLSCKKELVYSWESGEVEPGKEVQHQLSYLELQLLDTSQKISKSVIAENLMKDHGLSQISMDDVEEDV
jgi:ribosome-binding protein aMBF1 (putative translation factor)